jgi:cell division protein ZipA
MPELRWTLLILGGLFIVGLALWELRRQRQSPRQGMSPSAAAGSDRVAPTFDSAAESGRSYREPTITLPELHPEPRTATPDPQVIELDAATFAQLRAQDEMAAPPPAAGAADVGVVEVDASAELVPVLQNAPAEDSSVGFVTDADDVHEMEASQTAEPAPLVESEPPREMHPEGATADGTPVVEWPREETRKIVALRLVSAPAARFPGRAVRQALAAEGFVLGKFDIFHKAGPDERAVLSAASLTKPGTFALNTIDAQRYGGISLFAVLPGPLPAQDTFDELLTTARSLNDRLQGALQDERGEPLTPMRSASIRQSLSSGGEEGSGISGSEPPNPQLRH